MKRKLSSAKIIALGFAAIIAVCTILLCLPISSRSGEWTSPLDALFTATSSTCVTGLIVYDTYTYWSVFGQLVILCFIQIGGLGFMTVITMLLMFMRRKINLHERRLIMQSSGALQLSGITSMVKRILLGTAIFEGLGAIIFAIRFCPQMGFWRGIYNAVFHSVSAFCNAGFDIMGKYGKFGSFTKYVDDPVVSLTICFLIIIGGIGFLVWDDIFRHGIHIKKYELHTKLVLSVTAILVLLGWGLFYIFERDASMAGMGTGERLLASFFQSVTTRTAGFNTVDQAALSESGGLLTSVLMLIGGSPGSTAGGIKTTTIAVIVLNAFSSARRTNNISIFKKRIDTETVRQASAIFAVYILAVIASTAIIAAIEPITLNQAVYETCSAIGTVGLTMGITPSLGVVSKIILTVLMYTGRIGGMTLMLALSEKHGGTGLERPAEKILIG